MKKILLATSILAGTVAVASAEVTLSGDARFGIRYDSSAPVQTRLEKRMTVNIDGSGESDSGISYGARIRIRSNETGTGISNANGAFGAWVTGARVFVKAGGLEVAAGNINGAIEWMPGLYATSAGLQGLGWHGIVTNSQTAGYWNWDGFSSSGNGAEGVEVMYSAGSFGAHLSHSDNTATGFSGGTGARRTAAHVSYAFGDWTVALGGQSSSVAAQNKVVLTVGGKVGNFNLNLNAAQNNNVAKWSLGAGTTFGATSVNAFYGQETGFARAHYGLGVSHDLGGVTLVGGIANNPANGATLVDAGVSFSF